MNYTANTPTQFADAEVIQQVLQGHTALFEILIRRYNAQLYKIGRVYGFNHQDTEDLMQETYINAYQYLKRLESQTAFKAWLIKIMLHHCYHKMQKHNRQYAKETNTKQHSNIELMGLLNTYNDTANAYLRKEFIRVIECSLNKLPEDYRLTFVLRELAGLSVAETAELMSTTITNVKVRLNRARLMLRKEIEQLYSPEDIYEFNLIYCDKIVTAVMSKIKEMMTE